MLAVAGGCCDGVRVSRILIGPGFADEAVGEKTARREVGSCKTPRLAPCGL